LKERIMKATIRGGTKAAALLCAALWFCAFLGACGATAAAAPADDGYGDWGEVVFSEETEARAAVSRAISEAPGVSEERIAGLIAEEAKLAAKLAELREIEGLPELDEKLRETYTALAEETEKEIEALIAERRYLEVTR
jgi:hypothetical protein